MDLSQAQGRRLTGGGAQLPPDPAHDHSDGIRLVGPPSPGCLVELGGRQIKANQKLVLKFVDELNRHRAERDLERGTPGQHQLGDVTRPGGKVGFHIFGGAPAGPESRSRWWTGTSWPAGP